MKILIVCSFKSYASGGIAPFISDQVESLRAIGIEIDYYLIKNKGVFGYFKSLPSFYKKIMKFNPDIIHAHYGLAGLFCQFQFLKPVVTTYHGSDINVKKNLVISKFSIFKSNWNIFVSDDLVKLSIPSKKYSIIPCGVDLKLFQALDKYECRTKLNIRFDSKKKYVLFSKMFYDPVKNYPLAYKAIKLLDNVELIEFIGYSRREACYLMNACDAVILTSFMEGSPQFIKEAMACNCPIVSVDVGDVKNVIKNTEKCFITEYNEFDIAEKLKLILDSEVKSNGREMISDYDNNLIAIRIKEIYENLLKVKKTI